MDSPASGWATILVVAVALCTVVGVWTGSIAMVALTASVTGVAARRVTVALVVLILGSAAVMRVDAEWQALAPDELGRFDGWASVVAEARPWGSATRVLVELEGERFEIWVRGRAGRERVSTWRGGDRVVVAGERVALDASRARRVAWEHVVGELELDWTGDVLAAGRPLDRASNRVRQLVEAGAAHLPDDDGALLRGLVIGDDRDQPPEMIERFRASGLSHLTAVSGQNVAFVLAAAGPLLRRARPVPRLVVTLALIGWFVALTRFEPSIVRAGAMAGLASVAFALGYERAPVRLLAVAVVALVLVDPLLVWSIGFWLSVGATAGVTTIGPWLAPRLAALGWMAAPVAVTVGAQVGVALPSLLVFGRLPLVGTVANLIAVPVAGAVMMYGLPACMLAGAVPMIAPVAVFPLRIGVRWIDTVAAVGAAAEPPAPWPAIGWSAVAGAVGVTLACWRRRGRLRR